MILLEEPKKKKIEFKLTAVDRFNNITEVWVHECPECSELVPRVGKCTSCGTAYSHKKTVEDFKTGFLHYIYECSGCPEDERKAQKVIKFTEVVDESRINIRKNLADDFLEVGRLLNFTSSSIRISSIVLMDLLLNSGYPHAST